MSAFEKVAWTELVVSLVALTLAACLYPWLGDASAGAFGLLGLLGCTVFFLRRKGNEIVTDERDHVIQQRATQIGVMTAWMTTFLTLTVIVVWYSQTNRDAVSLGLLNWLIWTQFVVCYAVKGLVGILSYRGTSHAA